MTVHQLPKNAYQVRHLDQLLNWWAMETRAFQALTDQLLRVDVLQHLANYKSMDRGGSKSRAYNYSSVSDGLAIVPLMGTLLKHELSFGMATATTLVRRDLRALLVDNSVKSMLIHVESPGGTSAGTAELFDDIYAAARRKTVWAYIDDLGASAAYWAAAGADRIIANASAKIGSIGTYAVIQDLSEMAAKEGIKVHVVRAGKFKGMGTAGTQINTEQLGELQRVVDGVNDLFLQGVAKGRRLPIERVRDLADGRVHLAADAVKLGLIDAVDTFENTIAKLKAMFPTTPPARSAPAVNAITSHDAGATNRMIQSLANQSAPPARSAKDQWHDALAAQVAAGKSRADAASAVDRQFPQLRQAMLEQSNQ